MGVRWGGWVVWGLRVWGMGLVVSLGFRSYRMARLGLVLGVSRTMRYLFSPMANSSRTCDSPEPYLMISSLLGFCVGRIIRPKRPYRIASRIVDLPLSFSPVIRTIPSGKRMCCFKLSFLKFVAWILSSFH